MKLLLLQGGWGDDRPAEVPRRCAAAWRPSGPALAIAGRFLVEGKEEGEAREKLIDNSGPETASTTGRLLPGVRARTGSGWAATIRAVALLYTASSVMRQLKESTDFITAAKAVHGKV